MLPRTITSVVSCLIPGNSRLDLLESRSAARIGCLTMVPAWCQIFDP
jgi:hypothetical protein